MSKTMTGFQALWLALALAGLLCACSHRCPSGTTPMGKSPPRGTAQWCEEDPDPTDALPVPGRSYEAALEMNIRKPASFVGRSLRGPMTTWTPAGLPASHGNYASSADGDAVPDGLWTFWHDSGEILSQGNYQEGTPVGCFSFWDKDGTQQSAIWSPADTLFHEASCEGPGGKQPEHLAARIPDSPVQGDVSFQGFLSSGGFGIENQMYEVKKPTLSHNLEFAFRRYLRRFRFGGRMALRTSEDGDKGGLGAGSVAFLLPSPHQRLGLEVMAALGVQYTEVKIALEETPNLHGSTSFTDLYAAIEVGAAIRVHDYIELLLATRLEGGLPRSREITTVFCYANGCPETRTDTWRTGRPSLGLALGVRFSLR